jgi:hypothetical protein
MIKGVKWNFVRTAPLNCKMDIGGYFIASSPHMVGLKRETEISNSISRPCHPHLVNNRTGFSVGVRVLAVL